MKIAKPECPQGYPHDQLRIIFGDHYDAFNQWMDGQTQSVCDGRRYDHYEQQYHKTECADKPHGIVAYAWDVEKFWERGPKAVIYD